MQAYRPYAGRPLVAVFLVLIRDNRLGVIRSKEVELIVPLAKKDYDFSSWTTGALKNAAARSALFLRSGEQFDGVGDSSGRRFSVRVISPNDGEVLYSEAADNA